MTLKGAQREARGLEMYISPPHNRVTGNLWISNVEGAEPNQIPGRNGGVLWLNLRFNYIAGKSRKRTFFDNIPQRLAVIREFGHRFAEIPRLASPVVHGEGNMMSGDGTCYSFSTLLDRFDCRTSCCVLEYNP